MTSGAVNGTYDVVSYIADFFQGTVSITDAFSFPNIQNYIWNLRYKCYMWGELYITEGYDTVDRKERTLPYGSLLKLPLQYKLYVGVREGKRLQ